MNKPYFKHPCSEKILDIILSGIALGRNGPEIFDRFQHFLPKYVQLIAYPHDNMNCVGYALNLGKTDHNPLKYLIEVKGWKSAQYFVLFDHNLQWIHVGKVLSNGQAESKWGWEYPIFTHPIWFYPGRFTTIKFYVKNFSSEPNSV